MFRNNSRKNMQLRPSSMGIKSGQTPHNRLSGVLLFGLILISLIFLGLGLAQNRQLVAWRAKALDMTSPVLEYSAIPAGYIQRSIDRIEGFYDINRKLENLRRENKELRRVKWNLEKLERNNNKLKALLNSARDARLKFVTGQIISGNPGLFGQHMLVNIGHRNGIDSGYAVINADGFIGRTFETGGRTSRILLLTDKASKIPVTIGKQGARGVASGTGFDFPRLDFLPQNTKIYEGDMVFTSGHGGDLPKGLRIGVVKKIGNEFHIATSARQAGTEYVSVLYFEQAGLALKP